ncbi:MAG: hypothetical protein ACOCQD_03680 [archaeon]
MKIIKRINNINLDDYLNNTTEHLTEKRLNRYRTYIQKLGRGKPIATYVVDKGHVNGNEIHVLCDNRLIYIFNQHTMRYITVLYARDGQIKRYFKKAPMHLFDNFKEGLNYI